MKGDGKLIAYMLNICITFQKLHKQATHQNIQVTTEALGTNGPMAKSQGHSQSQLGTSCSNRGPITLTFQESLLLLLFLKKKKHGKCGQIYLWIV